MIDLQLTKFFKKCQQFVENWENGGKNPNPYIFCPDISKSKKL